LLRQGISYAEFSEIAKAVYVEVALKDFKVAGRKATRTRVAVMTGLTRKEVKRVVLVGWHTDTDFTGPYGLPLELQYETNNPGEPTFAELVKRHSGDMSPRSILDELIRVGAVRETDAGWYRVLRREYITDAQGRDTFERTGFIVRNFINTVDFNMMKLAPGKGRFERHVFPADGLRAEDMPLFDAFLRERCQTLLEELDNWLAKLPIPDAKKGDVVMHTGVGVYHYMTNEADDRDLRTVLQDEGLVRLADEKEEEDTLLTK
jgi:hypothetical protein